MAAESVTVEIQNWVKFNGRNDVKKSTWFRLEHSLADDHQFFAFTHEEFRVWIYILCLASRKSSATVLVNYSHALRVSKLTRKGVDSAIRKLISIGCLHACVTDAYADVTDAYADVTDAGPTQRDVTDETRRDGTTRTYADGLPRLAQIWNENRGKLPEVKGCDAKRRRHVEARWQEESNPEYWVSIVQRMAQSPFCNGKSERGWKADFDFLIQPDTRHKVLEGKYDDRTRPVLPSAEDDPFLAELKRDHDRLKAEGRL